MQRLIQAGWAMEWAWLQRWSQAVLSATLALQLFILPLVFTGALKDNFTVVKWLLLHAGVCLSLVCLLGFSNLSLPKLPKLVLVPLGLACVLTVVSYGQNNHGLHLYPLLNQMSFFVLIYMFFTYYRTGNHTAIMVRAQAGAVLLVCLYGVCQLYGFEPFPHIAHSLVASASFGNPNMTAQYLGLSVPLILYGRTHCHLWTQKLCDLATVLAFAYIALLNCRSIYLGLTFALSIWFLFAGGKRRKLLTCVVLGVVLAGVVKGTAPGRGGWTIKSAGSAGGEVGTQVHQQPTPIAGAKPTLDYSSNVRLSLWSDALRMIAAKPWSGHGPGNFEFAHMPFHITGQMQPSEFKLFKSPHNEFLRIAAEYGILFSMLLILLVGWFFYVCWRLNDRSLKALFLSSGAVLASEMMFQFPFENALPNLLVAQVFGIFLAQLPVVSWRDDLGLRTAVVSVCTVLVAIMGYRSALANYYTANDTQKSDKMHIACRVHPDHWRGCISSLHYLTHTGRLTAAKQLAEDILQREPYNFMAIKYLAAIAFRQGKHAEGCYALKVYDLMFWQQSALAEDFTRMCQQVIVKRPDKDSLARFDLNEFPFSQVRQKLAAAKAHAP